MDQELLQENIIKILGIQGLPDEQKTLVVDKTSELVEKRLLNRIVESLSEDHRQGFFALIDSGDSVGLSQFLHQHCPMFNDWMADEIVRVKTELNTLAKA